MTDNHLSELRFDTLALSESMQAGIRDAGFEFCTPIQASTLPVALSGKDVAGQAQTGTGKTAAFLIATYERLLASDKPTEGPRNPRAFMLAPTRELAIQIAKDAEVLGKHTNFKVALKRRIVLGKKEVRLHMWTEVHMIEQRLCGNACDGNKRKRQEIEEHCSQKPHNTYNLNSINVRSVRCVTHLDLRPKAYFRTI